MISVGEYADKIMVMIRADIASGMVPADVGSFSELHDYCDANGYALQAMPEDIVLSFSDEGCSALVNAVLDECDRRIRAGELRGCGCPECQRLGQSARGSDAGLAPVCEHGAGCMRVACVDYRGAR